MVCVKLVSVILVVVLFIVLGLVNILSVADSHLKILPVCPLKVKSVLFVPVQTIVAPDMVPPTVSGSAETVTVVVPEFTEEQTPLFITAL